MNTQDQDDYTPLHYAIAHGNTHCIKELLSVKNIDVGITNTFGQTPISLAQSLKTSIKEEIIPLLNQHRTRQQTASF